MFHAFGERFCYSLIWTVAKEYFDKPREELELIDFQRAYRRWITARQPYLPEHQGAIADFCVDPALEEQLVQPLHQISPLDDVVYKQHPKNFKLVGRDRDKIAADAAHAERVYRDVRGRDPSFWDVFDLYVTRVVCVDSRYAWGGTSSNALGVIYLINPRKRTAAALYEIFVHELSHLVMFVDSLRVRHYRDPRLLTDRANWCVSAIFELERPLDKVLHSLVIATEILLHRELTLGGGDASVHPASDKLVQSAMSSAAAVLELQSRRQLLAPRGVELVEKCREHLVSMAGTKRAARAG